MTDREESRPVTVITGTSRGIGRHLAEHYLDRGHVVIGCSRGDADWDAEGYRHRRIDVADEEGVGALFADLRHRFGRVDHLINNAGIASMNHSLITPASSVRRILETNVLGTFLFSREAAKVMRRERRGRIVNFTTVAVPLKLAGEAAYAASKAAVESLTQVLAREFAVWGITVNAVGPGPVDTDLIRGVSEEKIRDLVSRQAIARKSTLQDVTNTVDFLLQEDSSMITGQILYLGGV